MSTALVMIDLQHDYGADAGALRLDGLPAADEVVVKTRDSAFHRTDLADLLREHSVDRLVLTGKSTQSCVAATATDT